MHGDSSDFESDKHEAYMKNLCADVQDKQVVLTEKELNLIKGIHTLHLKQLRRKSAMGIGMLNYLNRMMQKDKLNSEALPFAST